MELCNRGLADVVEPVGLAAVVADRVPVTVGNHGFHRITREPSTYLDRIDIDRKSYTVRASIPLAHLISATPVLMKIPAVRDSLKAVVPAPAVCHPARAVVLSRGGLPGDGLV